MGEVLRLSEIEAALSTVPTLEETVLAAPELFGSDQGERFRQALEAIEPERVVLYGEGVDF